jgi:hypothetical protein
MIGPTCVVCFRRVERVDEEVDGFGRLRITVTCHGCQETVTFDPGENVRGLDLSAGLSSKYYRHESSFAGEVDHADLIRRLVRDYPDGWALSTSTRSLRDVLPLCPPDTRVCAWVKPIGVPPATMGLHSTWEPVVVAGGRQRQPGVRDWLRAMPARGGGVLPGRKPIAFCAWLFDALGMSPGDSLDDLFPGTGVVTRAWRELSVAGAGRRFQASPLEEVDASLVDELDGEACRSFQVSREVLGDGVYPSRSPSSACAAASAGDGSSGSVTSPSPPSSAR